jgi:hypothetical protein
MCIIVSDSPAWPCLSLTQGATRLPCAGNDNIEAKQRDNMHALQQQAVTRLAASLVGGFLPGAAAAEPTGLALLA